MAKDKPNGDGTSADVHLVLNGTGGGVGKSVGGLRRDGSRELLVLRAPLLSVLAPWTGSIRVNSPHATELNRRSE
jgi:hypothetical protein